MKTFSSYSKLIIGGSFLMVFISVGIGYNCWSVLTIPICTDLSISRQQFSVFFTIISLGRMISSILLGSIIPALGARRIMKTGAALLPVVLALASKIKTLYGLYFIGALVGLTLPSVSFFIISILMGNWFIKYRGTATGIAFMGSGFGGLIFAPVINRWILSFGWRNSVLILAAICAVALFILCKILIFTPEEVNLVPDGIHMPVSAALDKETGAALHDLLRGGAFWGFLIFVASCYAIVQLINTITPFLTDCGLKNTTITAIYSYAMGSVAICRILSGKLCDKLGVIRATFICAVLSSCLMVGLLSINPAAPKPAAALIITGAGMANAVYTVCFPSTTAALFGQKDYSRIYGFITGAGELAGAAAPIIYGYIYSKTGSYYLSYQIFLACAAVGLCFFIYLIKAKVFAP